MPDDAASLSAATPQWSQYQESAAEHFRRLGFNAATNVSLSGVRSTHDIDVVVRFERAGISHLWVVECKDTARPVSKDKVLVLRTIVDDVGADRGILLCESGFQRGAREVVDRTNVLVTSLAELVEMTQSEVFDADVLTLERRLRRLEQRWFDLHGTFRRTAGGHGGTRMLPVISREVWPEGPIGLTGRMSFLQSAVQRARFGDFPVTVVRMDSDKLDVVDRAEFFERVLPLVEQLEDVVAVARQPDDR